MRPFQRQLTRRQQAVRVVALSVLLALPLCAWNYSVRMPGSSSEERHRPPTPSQTELARALRRDVEHLASGIGERNLDHHANLEQAALWIEAELERMGHQHVTRQTFEVGGKPCHNLEVELRGTTWPAEIMVVGAHYDTALGTPGANDNGSGVAALLALARRLSDFRPTLTLRLVWFTNEEPPHFQSADMGSVRYAKRARDRRENVVGMLSLETMGHFTDSPGTQHYPGPLQALYPDTGNFIAFVGDLDSRELIHRVISSFRAQAAFPSEGAALPPSLPGVGWSDHWAFWQQGYPALMVTDTAPFRYRHYHASTDTPDKLDYDRLARVVDGLAAVVRDLATPKSSAE